MRHEGGWQTRPVFVSSTFRDMNSERDWLRDRVIPELEERLRARRAQLEVVDLRWGVETVSAGDEAAKELLVLKVCLEEIEHCRPFLIVLLGDRYGWVPDAERMRAAVTEAGFATDVEGKSVTALEIEFGVLADPEQRARTRFYFRAPLPYDRMDPDVAAQFSEQHSSEPGAGEAHERLQALKARIETDPTWSGRVRHYSADWDEAAERVTGLEEFGAMVLEDVWADLEAEIPRLEQQAEVTWQDEERAAFEEFVANRDRDFRGRVALTDELAEFALGAGDEWALSLTGGPGSGKSALLAHLYRRLEGEDALLLAHAAGISPRSASVESLLLRFIGELADFLGEEAPVEEGASAEEIEQAFASLLGRAALRTRVVVLIDALNQFEPTPRAQYVTWLPVLWPENARLITTAIPCTASEAVEQRERVRVEVLPPLTTAEAEEIAAAVCERYHRTLNRDVLWVLLDKRTAAGEPSAGNPLWLELALEALNLLDQDDFERLGRDFEGTAEERLLQLLLDVAEKLPADIEELYGWLLRESEETWGTAWAREFASLIAVSRGGWRESDFEELLPARTGAAWDPLRFAGLRRSFRAHLARRGHSQWDFFHAQARAAVRARYLGDPAREREVHAALADHLLALSREDPLHQSDTMFHLIEADDKQRAALYYGDESMTEGELTGATQRLAQHIVATAGAETGPGLEWALELLELEQVPAAQRGPLCSRFIFDVRDALENETRLGLKLTLLRATREALERVAAADPGNAEWQHDLAASHERLGDMLVAQGDLSWALGAYQACLTIVKGLAAADPCSLERQRVMALNHLKLGDVLVAQGDLSEALVAYQGTHETLAQLAAADPGDPEWERDLGAIHDRLGDVLRAQGDLSGAAGAYRAALAIAERLATADKSNTKRQRDLWVSHSKLGEVLVAQGDLPAALLAHQAALAIAGRLAAADPGNPGSQRDLWVSHNTLGDVLREQGDLSGALGAYQASLAIAERLVEADRGHMGWQSDLSVSHNRAGDVLLAQGDLAGALGAYQAALAIRERLAAADSGNAEWQRDLSVSHYKLAQVARQAGQSATEREHLLRCRDVLRAMRERGMHLDPQAAQLLAQLEALPDAPEKQGEGRARPDDPYAKPRR